MTLHKRTVADGINDVPPPIALSNTAVSLVVFARETYLRGDFQKCISILEGHVFTEPRLRAEAEFVLARALLRVHRSADVVALLGPALSSYSNVDEACTARMLYGTALALCHEVDQGIELLATTAGLAKARHADRAIRAEIAYFQGVCHWIKSEYAHASAFATIAERANLDVLSVRATQLRAFVALVNGQYPRALALFERARQAYARCRGRDLDLATQVLFQIAFLEMNLRSAKVRGSHAAPGGRTIPGTSFGPAIATSTRMLLMTADSWLYALDGDRFRAFRIAHDAIGVAPTPAWRVRALAAGAAVFEAFGEVGNARIFADEAARIVPSVRWNATTDEERIGLLRLAEVLAAVNPTAAPAVLDRYDGLSSRMDATRVLRDRDADPRLVGWEAYVRGLVARQRGELERAGELFRKAADTFGSCGFLWRAALALIELDATPIDTRGELALERAAVIVRDNFPDSFLARRLGAWAWAYVDPVGSKLTPAQRDVLRRLLEGKKAPAISAETNRAHTTVRKHIKDIHAAFGTHSFAELFAECLRRGIASPGVPDRGAPRAVAVR